MPESALNDEEALDLVREEAGLLKSNRIRLMPASCCGSVATATVDELEETWELAVKTGKIKTN